jgi:polysaccharide biosynthesis/export protein
LTLLHPRFSNIRLIAPKRVNIHWFVALLLILVFLTTGCAGTHSPSGQDPSTRLYLGADEIERMNQMILAQATPDSEPSEHLLGAGDLLNISVFEIKELDTTGRVSANGLINLPLIGSVHVQGLTPMAAEKKIEALYRKKYIKDPHVSIFIEEHVSQRITLVGQFKMPGTYDYPAKRRLLDVIAIGGGLSEKAGQTVQIRKSRLQGPPIVFMVDLDRLIAKGDTQLNIEINGGDVLFIAEAGVFFVDGAVRLPGAYAIKHRLTLMEALVMAGGLQPKATKQIKLIRADQTGERQLIELDLDQHGTSEAIIMDRDVLIVEAGGIARFMSGFGISILGTGFQYQAR